jgi:hypothetical protein
MEEQPFRHYKHFNYVDHFSCDSSKSQWTTETVYTTRAIR